MKPVKSSQIKSVGYDSATRQMKILFNRSDKEYTFYDVPDDVVARFWEADSKGRFFNQNIRGKFGPPEGQGA